MIQKIPIGTAAKQSGHDNVAIYAGPGTLVLKNVISQ